MSPKSSAQKKSQSGKSVGKSLRLSLLDRPLASGKVKEGFTLYNYLTFMNIVIALGVMTALIFIGNAVSVPLAMLLATLIGLFLLILYEVSTRRRWEKDLMTQLGKMAGDYERLTRDIARNRNDSASLRKKLSHAAGTAAKYTKAAATGEPVEQRMIKSLIEQLAMLDDYEDERDNTVAETEVRHVGEDAEETPAGEVLDEDQVIRIINAAAKQDKVDLFLQPIVGLPQRKVRFYEMLSRIRVKPETYLPAADYIEVAHKRDLMPIIDNLLLLRGLQIIRATEEGSPYNRAFFFNISTLTLNDPKFMSDLVEFIAQNRTLAPRLVFEMSQRDIQKMSADSYPILQGLSKLGCRFSMDQVKSIKIDPKQLEARHIRFIKLDAALMMDEISDTAGFRQMRRLKEDLDRHGIDLIVEKIETERQVLELMELDIDYGQGYLFGKPALYDKK